MRELRATSNGKPRVKSTVKTLAEGVRYLHRNGLFIRRIKWIDDGIVFYEDWYGMGHCTKAHFVRTCPAEAIEEDVEYEKEFQRKYPID